MRLTPDGTLAGAFRTTIALRYDIDGMREVVVAHVRGRLHGTRRSD